MYSYYRYASSSDTVVAISLVLAIVAVILALIFIIPEKKRDTLPKFFVFLHDLFNFKFLLLEIILKVFYIFSTCFAILFGFITIFFGGNLVLTGLLIMILGPIIIRIIYEAAIMIILLVKNVIQINNKIKADSSASDNENSPFQRSISMPGAGSHNAQVNPMTMGSAPGMGIPPLQGSMSTSNAVNNNNKGPVNPADSADQPQYIFCTNCGTRYDKNVGVCPKCGKTPIL